MGVKLPNFSSHWGSNRPRRDSMPLASNMSRYQDDSQRKQWRQRQPQSFFQAGWSHFNSFRACDCSAIPQPSHTNCYNIDITWATEISPKARAHRHSMEGKERHWLQRWRRGGGNTLNFSHCIRNQSKNLGENESKISFPLNLKEF